MKRQAITVRCVAADQKEDTPSLDNDKRFAEFLRLLLKYRMEDEQKGIRFRDPQGSVLLPIDRNRNESQEIDG